MQKQQYREQVRRQNEEAELLQMGFMRPRRKTDAEKRSPAGPTLLTHQSPERTAAPSSDDAPVAGAGGKTTTPGPRRGGAPHSSGGGSSCGGKNGPLLRRSGRSSSRSIEPRERRNEDLDSARVALFSSRKDQLDGMKLQTNLRRNTLSGSLSPAHYVPVLQASGRTTTAASRGLSYKNSTFPPAPTVQATESIACAVGAGGNEQEGAPGRGILSSSATGAGRVEQPPMDHFLFTKNNRTRSRNAAYGGNRCENAKILKYFTGGSLECTEGGSKNLRGEHARRRKLESSKNWAAEKRSAWAFGDVAFRPGTAPIL